MIQKSEPLDELFSDEQWGTFFRLTFVKIIIISRNGRLLIMVFSAPGFTMKRERRKNEWKLGLALRIAKKARCNYFEG